MNAYRWLISAIPALCLIAFPISLILELFYQLPELYIVGMVLMAIGLVAGVAQESR